MSLIINPYRYGGAAYYLDDLAVAPRAVLSLRKLIRTATVAIRVRRSSDNAEQDIGFDGDALDTAALASFVGINSGYVTKVYDQTGNSEHAEQATAANQPRIFNAGTYDGKLVFNGTSHSLKITSLAQGTPQVGVFAVMKRASGLSSAKVLLEGSTNYNSNAQNFLLFNQSVSGTDRWSMNACNAAGSQRQNFYPAATAALGLVSFAWDRSLTGTTELRMRDLGFPLAAVANQTVEQTGNFTSYDTYIGARGGTSLYADMELETLVFYNGATASIRSNIEDIVADVRTHWMSRFNAPTFFTKAGSTYFMVDCWHHRVLYTDDITTPAGQWKVLDDSRVTGPHSVATDGYLYVVDDTEGESVESYKSDGAGGYVHVQSLTVASSSERPHRLHYDIGTSGFYVINGGRPDNSFVREMVKLTRSGDTLSIAHTSTLPFLSGGYSRGFNIIGGKMYIVAEPGKVFEVSFNGTGTYTLDATYDLPSGFESPNDVYQDSNGDWWVTATENKILKGASLAAIDAGTYTDMYSALGLGGTPYYLSEFDGAMWIPEIIDRNGLTKIVAGSPAIIHNYGPENASDLARHSGGPG